MNIIAKVSVPVLIIGYGNIENTSKRYNYHIHARDLDGDSKIIHSCNSIQEANRTKNDAEMLSCYSEVWIQIVPNYKH